MRTTNILIVDHNKENKLKERLQGFPNFNIIGSTDNADIGFALSEKQQPDVILFNVDMPGHEGIAVAEVFSMEFPKSSLILITNSDSKRVLRHALKVGAKEVITMPIEDDRLYRLIIRVFQRETERQGLFTVEKKIKPQFKIITVFSTKGGVGKTTIALNLAIFIRKLTGKRTVLVDLDLMSGNVGLMAGVPTKISIRDVVDELATIDAQSLDNYCAEHSSGLRILPAPSNPELATFIGAEDVEKTLQLLAETYNYIIIDSPNYFHDTVIPGLEIAQDILLVTTLDLAAIQNMKQCMEMLANLNLKNKVKVIVNRVGYTGGIKIKDIEEELGTTAFNVIPNFEKVAINAVNMGSPIAVSSKNASVLYSFENMASRLLINEVQPRPLSGWRKLFNVGGSL